MGAPAAIQHRGCMDPDTPTSTLPPPPARPTSAVDTPSAAPPPGETARSAALWLGGTGAFLILVAAGVLVAMRWDDIAAWLKLAGLLVANVGVIGAGLRYRDKVPATAAALFHLGAFLVPISAAASTVQADLAWEEALLAASAATIATLAALDRVRPSKALSAVELAAVVPLVGGVAAVTGVATAPSCSVRWPLVDGHPDRDPLRGSPAALRPASLWAGLAAAMSAVLVAVARSRGSEPATLIQSARPRRDAPHPVTHAHCHRRQWPRLWPSASRPTSGRPGRSGRCGDRVARGDRCRGDTHRLRLRPHDSIGVVAGRARRRRGAGSPTRRPESTAVVSGPGRPGGPRRGRHGRSAALWVFGQAIVVGDRHRDRPLTGAVALGRLRAPDRRVVRGRAAAAGRPTASRSGWHSSRAGGCWPATAALRRRQRSPPSRRGDRLAGRGHRLDRRRRRCRCTGVVRARRRPCHGCRRSSGFAVLTC